MWGQPPPAVHSSEARRPLLLGSPWFRRILLRRLPRLSGFPAHHFFPHRLLRRLRPLPLLIPPIMKRLVRRLFFHIPQLTTHSNIASPMLLRIVYKFCHSERPHREESLSRPLLRTPQDFLSIGRNYTIAPIPMKLHRKYLWLTCPIYPLLCDIMNIYSIKLTRPNPGRVFYCPATKYGHSEQK